MKTLLLLPLLISASVLCSDKNPSQPSAKPMTQDLQTPPILLGKKKRADLEAEPYVSWFRPNYESHPLNEKAIAQLKPLLKKVKIKIFMGTWCGDSKSQTPAFYKILDAAGYNQKNLTLIAVSRDKDTPEGYEKGMDIERVPTFIFYKKGKEVNRIVEYPVSSLEEDMLVILNGQAYKHAYAD